MALHARDAGDVAGLAIVPIGLTFERKDAPRTRVLVQIGEPIVMDGWRAARRIARPPRRSPPRSRRDLRAVTLNYASADDAARAVRLASLIAALFERRARRSASSIARLGAEATHRAAHRRTARRDCRSPTRRFARRPTQLVRRLDAVQREVARSTAC